MFFERREAISDKTLLEEISVALHRGTPSGLFQGSHKCSRFDLASVLAALNNMLMNFGKLHVSPQFTRLALIGSAKGPWVCGPWNKFHAFGRALIYSL